MRNFLTAALAGMFILSLQGPLQAQKEVEPPAIPPMLEDKPPLVQLEPKDTEAPAKVQESKAKGTTKIAKKRESSSAGVKNKGQARKTTVSKKKRAKATKKKGVTAKPKSRQNSSGTG